MKDWDVILISSLLFSDVKFQQDKIFNSSVYRMWITQPIFCHIIQCVTKHHSDAVDNNDNLTFLHTFKFNNHSVKLIILTIWSFHYFVILLILSFLN